VELRCASAFSFLAGATTPEDLVERAVATGHRALALADRDGLYGIPRFHQAARAAGLEALVGARLSIPGPPAAPDLLLLVETPRGYRNLSRLLTRAHARGAKGTPKHVTWEELAEHAADLVALLRGDASLDAAALDRTRTILGRARVWVDVSRPLDRRVEAATRRAAALAEALGAPVVATGDVRYARPQDRTLLDVLSCLAAKTTLDAAGRRLAANAEHHLQAPVEVARRFADRPGWVRATRAVAERCAFRLGDLGYRFPVFPVPSGETPDTFLRRLVSDGARSRYGHPLPARVRRQIEHELALIGRLGLAGYFVIVWDIVRFARERGMLAQGRGSAANSAVCYALGITAVDPVGMELLFERFLSEERGEWPDIDVDLPSGERRESVIQYVFERYGAHGAAMTANVITWRTRLAVREAGKVLGLGADVVDRLARTLSTLELREDLDETRALLRQGGVDPDAPRVGALLELVERLRGLPRHLGQHSGGVVIAAGRLDEVVPIEPAAMPGRRVIQWDKDDCADLGIIKIDLLGLGMLNALERTIGLVAEHEGVALDLARLPTDDVATWAMIQRADTMGTFQIESRAQMATLPRMKPACFYDLVVEVAIIRPGPIVGRMVHPYLDRRAGRQPVTMPHPSLEPILRRTLGVPLFQEQLLRIAMTAAGFSGGEAEELRRAMGFKRSLARMKAIETRLRRGMDARGIVGEAQEAIVRGITSFALYGFPESHAASFALIAWASAWIKCHHPAAFLAGLLDAWPMGFYAPASLVKDAQRHGVEVRPVDVAGSCWACTLETRPPPAESGRGGGRTGPAVRLPLRFVRGLREEAARRIEAARSERPFAHSADLARRAELSRREMLALAELGALASIDPGARKRRAALWQVAGLDPDARSLFAGAPPAAGGAPLPEMSALEATLADYRASGLSTGPHVMAHLRSRLRARGMLAAAELRSVPDGRWVRTAGHVIVRQRPGSAKGMCFLTLEDETGSANAVLTPPLFRRFRVPLHTAPLLEIEGPIQNVDGVIHVRVRRLAPLALDEVSRPPPTPRNTPNTPEPDPAAARSALPRSHDYR
jgi:error-prone DNA polymerase